MNSLYKWINKNKKGCIISVLHPREDNIVVPPNYNQKKEFGRQFGSTVQYYYKKKNQVVSKFIDSQNNIWGIDIYAEQHQEERVKHYE